MANAQEVEGAKANPSGVDTSSMALRWILGLLIVGAAWGLAAIFVPFFLALILAIAFAPVASKLEQTGLTRGPSPR